MDNAAPGHAGIDVGNFPAHTAANVMAKPTNQKQANGSALDFEAQLWAAADKMRGHMDASEYKHVCLGLIFLKYISDAFEEKREQLLFGLPLASCFQLFCTIFQHVPPQKLARGVGQRLSNPPQK
jgi:hypothetical protein